jgi:hypothetical protein
MKNLSSSAIRSLPMGDFFAELGIGDFNFQSGFDGLNNIADSIGSIFGLGPEDRADVLTRGAKEYIPQIESVMTLYKSEGVKSALKLADSLIKSEQNAKKKFKSANSKAKADQNIKIMRDLKALIIKDSKKTIKEDKEQNPTLTADVSKSSNTMFLGIGVVILLLTKFTKIFK